MTKTKDKIIVSFWKLSKNKPINEITVKDITMKANINRSTFYNYFFDINDLIEQIENSIITEIKENTARKLNNTKLNYETLFNLISEMFSKYEEYIYIFLIKNNYMEFYNKLKKEFFPILEKSASINRHTPHFDYITSYMFNSILGLITHWYDTGKNISQEEFINLMFTLVREGASKYIS